MKCLWPVFFQELVSLCIVVVCVCVCVCVSVCACMCVRVYIGTVLPCKENTCIHACQLQYVVQTSWTLTNLWPPTHATLYIYIYNYIYDIIIYLVPFRINVTQIVNQLYNLHIQHTSNGSCHLWLFFRAHSLCAFSCDRGLYCFRVHTSNDWCLTVQRHSGGPHDLAIVMPQGAICSSPDTDGEGNFHRQIISPWWA